MKKISKLMALILTLSLLTSVFSGMTTVYAQDAAEAVSELNEMIEGTGDPLNNVLEIIKNATWTDNDYVVNTLRPMLKPICVYYNSWKTDDNFIYIITNETAPEGELTVAKKYNIVLDAYSATFVVEAINNIGLKYNETDDVYTAYMEKINNARNLYNQLNYQGQLDVGTQNLYTLTKAEDWYNQKEQEQIDAVISHINVLGDDDGNLVITKENYLSLGELILNAREAYNNIPEKSLIKNTNRQDPRTGVVNYFILKRTEEILTEYKNETADNFNTAFAIAKEAVDSFGDYVDKDEYVRMREVLDPLKAIYTSVIKAPVNPSVYKEEVFEKITAERINQYLAWEDNYGETGKILQFQAKKAELWERYGDEPTFSKDQLQRKDIINALNIYYSLNNASKALVADDYKYVENLFVKITQWLADQIDRTSSLLDKLNNTEPVFTEEYIKEVQLLRYYFNILSEDAKEYLKEDTKYFTMQEDITYIETELYTLADSELNNFNGLCDELSDTLETIVYNVENPRDIYNSVALSIESDEDDDLTDRYLILKMYDESYKGASNGSVDLKNVIYASGQFDFEKYSDLEIKLITYSKKVEDIEELREAAATFNLQYGNMTVDKEGSKVGLGDINIEDSEAIYNFYVSMQYATPQDFGIAFGAVDEAMSRYKALGNKYSEDYPDDNFIDEKYEGKDYYVDSLIYEDWDNIKEKLLQWIGEADSEEAQNLHDDLGELLENIKGLVPSDEYDSNFEKLNEYKAEFEEKNDEYQNLKGTGAIVVLMKNNTIAVIAEIEGIFADWDEAIEIMEKIDDIGEFDYNLKEWEDKIQKADNAYQASDERVKSFIAPSEFQKLENAKSLYADLLVLQDYISAVKSILPVVSQEQIEETQLQIDSLIILSDSQQEALEKYYPETDRMIMDRNMELECAKNAKAIDEKIVLLDDMERESEEYTALLTELTTQIEEIYNSVPALTFAMIEQYAKYENHKNDHDEYIANHFNELVEEIEIDFTNHDYVIDFAANDSAIKDAYSYYDNMTKEQQKLSAVTILLLQEKEEKLAVCVKASNDASTLKEKLNEFITKTDSYTEADFNEFSEKIRTLDSEIQSLITKTDDNIIYDNVYTYLYANGFIDKFYECKAILETKFEYITVKQMIEIAWSDSQELAMLLREKSMASGDKLSEIEEQIKETYVLCITEIAECEARYNTLYSEGHTGGEAVSNYSKLVWARKNIDAFGVDYLIEMIDNLPDVDSVKYSDSENVIFAKRAYDALSGDNQALVTNGGKLIALENKINELKSLYAINGGLSGDANGDEVVDIRDIIMIVDFIVERKNPSEIEFLRCNVVKDAEEETIDNGKLDLFDLLECINLINF